MKINKLALHRFSRLFQIVLSVIIVASLLIQSTAVRAGSSITATMTGAVVVDADGDGKADPGDTLEYTILVTNVSGGDVSGVSFDNTPDPNTTYVDGSLIYSPLTVDDVYQATGNVSISVPAASGVTANDVLESGTSTLSAFDTTSAHGGTVTMTTSGAGMGAFTYNPPVGYTGTDTFTYTLTNSVGSSVGKATITVSDMIWFVDNTFGACSSNCNGRLSNPFTGMLSSFGNTGDTIFVYQGQDVYNGSVALKGSQRLIGQGVALNATTLGFTPATFSVALPGATSKPTLGGTVTLASNVYVRAVNIATLNQPGMVSAGNPTGVTVDNNVTVRTTTGRAVSLTNTSGSFTFGSISSNGAANGISLVNTSGSFTVTGDGGNTRNGSGGTIQNSTGSGILINAAQDVNLRQMNLQNNGGASGAGTGGVYANNLTGSSSINYSQFDNSSSAGDDLININNNLGSATLTLDNNILQNTRTSAPSGDGIHIYTGDATSITASITHSTFAKSYGDHISASATGSGTLNLTIDGNAMSGGAGVLGSGILITTDSFPTFRGVITHRINNNVINGNVQGGAIVINPDAIGTGTVQGAITNNQIGTVGIANSGSQQASGIRIEAHGTVHNIVFINNNTIYQYNLNGINLNVGATDGANASSVLFDATIRGNVIGTPGAFATNGISLNGGTTGIDTGILCTDIGGTGALANSVMGSSANSATDIRVRQRFATVVRLPDYGGADNDNAAVAAYLINRNGGNGAPTSSATNNVSGGGSGFTGSAGCAQPPVWTTAYAPSSLEMAAGTDGAGGHAQVTLLPAFAGLIPPALMVAAQHASMIEALILTGTTSPLALFNQSLYAPHRSPLLGAGTVHFNIGTLQQSKNITLKYRVTINAVGTMAAGTSQVSNQGTVTYGSSSTELTDDPAVTGANNPTITLLDLPDLTIAKAHTGNFAVNQTGAQYTITVSNNGTEKTSGTVTVTDILPTGLTATGASSTGWSCIPGATVTCTTSDAINAGSSSPVITLVVDVAGSAPASVTNTASVSGGGETNTSNDSASDLTTVNQSADLEVGMTASPAPIVMAASNITYTITLDNLGPSTAQTVDLSDAVPANTTFVSASVTTGTGWSVSAPSVGGTGTVEFTKSTVSSGESAIFQIVVKVDSGTAASTVIGNTATASSATPDPSSANNSASTNTTVNVPTAVNIADLGSISDLGGIRVEWRTVQEVNMVGFYVYRGTAVNGARQRITADMIPALSSGEVTGNAYSFLDDTTVPGARYYYWVEAVLSDGSQVYGSVNGMWLDKRIYLPVSRK